MDVWSWDDFVKEENTDAEKGPMTEETILWED